MQLPMGEVTAVESSEGRGMVEESSEEGGVVAWYKVQSSRLSSACSDVDTLAHVTTDLRLVECACSSAVWI